MDPRTLVQAIDALLGGDPEALAALAGDDAEAQERVARLQAWSQRTRGQAARGVLAGGVAASLAEPLARVRDLLGGVVDGIDHHIAAARGPEPLPWQRVSQVREEIMDAYLDLGRAARLAADLADIVATGVPAAERPPLELNDVVERAVALARHRVGRGSSLALDLGSLPPAHLDGAQLAQALAHLIIHAAERADAGTTITIRTAPGPGGEQHVTVSYDLSRPDEGRAELALLLGDAVAAHQGRLRVKHTGTQTTITLALSVGG